MSTHPTKNAEIETVRAIAILLVLLRHLHYALPIGIHDYPAWLQGTWSGVDLFFVISGLVITRSLLRQEENVRLGGQRPLRRFLGAFYLRRVFRLLPASLLTVAVYALLAAGFNASGVFGSLADVGREAVYIGLYVYNLAVPYSQSSLLGWHWSLSLEEQFYLVYPILFWWLAQRRKRLVVFVAVVLVVNLIVRPVYLAYVPAEKYWPWLTTPTYLRLDLLFAGCVLALLPLERWVICLGKANYALGWMALLLVATIAGWLGFQPLWVYPLILLGSVYLVGLAASQQGYIPTNRVFLWIGARSYALYLINIPCLYVADECYYRLTGQLIDKAAWLPALAVLVSAHVLMVVVAEGLYRLVEAPMIARGVQLANQMAHSRK